MKKNTITWISLLVLIVSAVFMAQGRGAIAQGNPNPPTSPVTGNVTNGKALFFNYSCYACHGYNGETGRAFFSICWKRRWTAEFHQNTRSFLLPKPVTQ